jgi:hypothetical protein
LGAEPAEFDALLDTGAEWSVVSPLAARLGGAVTGNERVVMSTRYGSVGGHLGVLDVRLVATEGDALAVTATVFVSDRWPLDAPQVVLGFRGLFERLAFALSRDEERHLLWFAA